MLSQEFFNKDPQSLAIALLGKVLRHRYIDPIAGPVWLSAKIIETEAYYRCEKGSHSSLGFTQKRRAMFMPPGTIYMYYARGSDSLNFSASGDGNGVLIKAGYPHQDPLAGPASLGVMQRLNPSANGGMRTIENLCSGQTLVCRALDLKVPEFNQRQLARRKFWLDDVGDIPDAIIQCRRLGIPMGRDEHLPYRFVHAAFAKYCTSNPLTKRTWRAGRDYKVIRAS